MKRKEKIRIKSMCCRVGISFDEIKSSPPPKPSIFDNKQPKSVHKGKHISIMFVIVWIGAAEMIVYSRQYSSIDKNYNVTAVLEAPELQLETIIVSDCI